MPYPEHETRAGTPRVERDMLFWSRTMIRAEFCYLNRSRKQYSFDRRVWFERKTGFCRDFLVPYLHVEVEGLRND